MIEKLLLINFQLHRKSTFAPDKKRSKIGSTCIMNPEVRVLQS